MSIYHSIADYLSQKHSTFPLEIITAVILFVIGMMNGGIIPLIINLLLFLMLLEVVRVVFYYAFSSSHMVCIHHLIDLVIIFILRETLLLLADVQDNLLEQLPFIEILGGMLLFFFFIRFISKITNTSDK